MHRILEGVIGRRSSRRRTAYSGLILGIALAVATAGIAVADNLVVDGDGLVPVSPNALNLGSICVGQSKSGTALLAIQRTGSGQNVYANNALVTVSAGGDASVSPAFSDNGIALPNNWGGAGNNTMSSDTATSVVTVSTTGSTLGAKTASVLYSAEGAKDGGGTLNRTATLTINWTVIACDTTPPVITPTVTGTLGDNGWYVSDVGVSWSVTDPESAISSTSGCGPATVDSDTSGQTFTCEATSLGGTASESVTIKRDTVAPTINGSASPAPNAHGWNNTNVTVDFTCADATSGIASCGPDHPLSGDGAGQSASGTAVDNAGHTAGTTVSGINIDKTAPAVSASASPAPNGNGWNNSAVTVSFTGTDGGSGIDACDAPVILSGDGAGQGAGGSCTDKAGNSASATASGINIDKTPPAVSVTGVTNGGHYYLGAVPAAGCDTTDALSGVATPATAGVSGGIGPGVGTFTATCSGASDAAGNAASSVSVSYTVSFHYSGLFRPVDNLPMLNRTKAGSAIPVKFSLNGNWGLNVFAAGFPKAISMSCPGSAPVDQVEETVAASNSGLQYDAASDQYTYVWKTDSKWANSCRQLVLQLADGQEVRANFTFTR